jgi:FkbM family methyltransferase
MSRISNQLKNGYTLIKSAKWSSRGAILIYLCQNLLNRTFRFPLSKRVVTVTLGGLAVSFQTKSAQLGAYVDIFNKNVYERLPGFIPKPGWTVVDAGANIGCYTLKQAKAVGPNGRVYAFEPYSESYTLLVKNIEQNCFSWVSSFLLALSSREGKLAFCVSPRETSTAQLSYPSPDEAPESFSEQKNTIAVESTTLDNFVQAHEIQHIDILKIDTEGAEADIVKGGLKYALPQTDKVVIESHNTRYLVRDLLDPLNFKLVWIVEMNTRFILIRFRPLLFNDCKL